ncbi:hypothetical protein H9L12_10780 [Sphingomonas rhizophila]|jgi:hypothetical protein|uniref:Uncharacterized protein n=1 Tax=Sphingomonas rhizophila TaxID=2071607 RepID=A0A7G9SA58_9SPHN|nr:hypothetical protein [Sphingomonas rhizophila]QNN64733.1 hypothetical protein H9L12_10780 [Sphingomonas rhizophila]
MDEVDYLERRASEEAAAAEATDCREARCIHLAMADHYRRMAKEIAGAHSRLESLPEHPR